MLTNSLTNNQLLVFGICIILKNDERDYSLAAIRHGRPPPRAIAKPVSDDQKNSVFLVFVFLVPLQLRKHVSSFDLLLPFFLYYYHSENVCVCVLHKRGHVYQPNGVEATCWIFTARFPFVSFCFTSYFPLDCRARVLRHPAFPPS